jgi:hypothetical protein
MWTPMAAILASGPWWGGLASLRRTARETRNPLGCDAEVGASADQDFFQAADEIDCTQGLALAARSGEAAQIKDGIPDDLPCAVEGDVAAAVAFKELNATLGKKFRRGNHVGGFRIAA